MEPKIVVIQRAFKGQHKEPGDERHPRRWLLYIPARTPCMQWIVYPPGRRGRCRVTMLQPWHVGKFSEVAVFFSWLASPNPAIQRPHSMHTDGSSASCLMASGSRTLSIKDERSNGGEREERPSPLPLPVPATKTHAELRQQTEHLCLDLERPVSRGVGPFAASVIHGTCTSLAPCLAGALLMTTITVVHCGEAQ